MHRIMRKTSYKFYKEIKKNCACSYDVSMRALVLFFSGWVSTQKKGKIEIFRCVHNIFSVSPKKSIEKLKFSCVCIVFLCEF